MKKHYYLIAVLVSHKRKYNEDSTHTTVGSHNKPFTPTSMLERALKFIESKCYDSHEYTFKVVNVSYLGCMTEEEYNS